MWGLGLRYLELDKDASGSLMPGVERCLSRERPSYLDIHGFSHMSKDVALKEKDCISELERTEYIQALGPDNYRFTYWLHFLLA